MRRHPGPEGGTRWRHRWPTCSTGPAAVLAELRDVDLDGLADDTLSEAVLSMQRLRGGLDVAEARVLSRWDAQRCWQPSGAKTGAAWLAWKQRVPIQRGAPAAPPRSGAARPPGHRGGVGHRRPRPSARHHPAWEPAPPAPSRSSMGTATSGCSTSPARTGS